LQRDIIKKKGYCFENKLVGKICYENKKNRKNRILKNVFRDVKTD